jgi:hypothetical protein
MNKTIKIDTWLGLRNDVGEDRYDAGDMAEATNIELDETGKVKRRMGTLRTQTGVWHSVWSSGHDAEYGYGVKDNVITLIDVAGNTTPVVAIRGRRVSYQLINGSVFWSDEHECGVLQGATNRKWGLDVPPQTQAIDATGTMLTGTYLHAMTYVNREGRESGAPACNATVCNLGGLQFVNLPVSTDTTVVSKRIYLTERDGELPFLIAEIPNTDTTLSVYAPTYGMALRTQFFGPPPTAGHMVRYVGGRAIIGSENYLWYSSPYEYELFDLRSGYLGFEAEVETFALLGDGVYVGTAKQVVWMAGFDPTEWRARTVFNIGAVRGTEVLIPANLVGKEGSEGDVMGWFSHWGFCLGFNGGSMKEITGTRYIPPIAREGASLLKIRGQSPQIVTTLFN